jgi:hypothetical protein
MTALILLLFLTMLLLAMLLLTLCRLLLIIAFLRLLLIRLTLCIELPLYILSNRTNIHDSCRRSSPPTYVVRVLLLAVRVIVQAGSAEEILIWFTRHVESLSDRHVERQQNTTQADTTN